MAINFENALGIHPKALEVRVQRAEIMANNLANADTPGYKARDIDFRAVLAEQGAGMGEGQLAMSRTNAMHMNMQDAGEVTDTGTPMLYRTPMQPSVDGNTVDTQQELAEFTKNVMDYQASFRFLNGKFTSLSKVLKGE